MKRYKWLFLFVLSIGLLTFTNTPSTSAQIVCNSTSSRPWESPFGWSCDGVPRIPLITDSVVINSAHTKVVTQISGAMAGDITVNGTLQVGNNTQAAPLLIDGDMVIGATGVIEAGPTSTAVGVVTVGGNLINDGHFDGLPTGIGSGVAILFAQPGNKTISGTGMTNAYQITTSPSTAVEILVTPAQITSELPVANTGTLIQTRAVNNAAVPFLEITDQSGAVFTYRGVELDTPNNLGNVTVSIEGVSICTDDPFSLPYAARCFVIEPEFSNTAMVRLWAAATDYSGVFYNTWGAFTYRGYWDELTTIQGTGTDGLYFNYAEGETDNYPHFLIATQGFAPTAVTLQSFSGSTDNPTAVTLWGSGLLVLATAGVFIRRRNTSR